MTVLKLKARLAELEPIIDRAERAFYEAGEALREIRDSHLYKLECSTFEEYCRVRWGMQSRVAYRYIACAELKAALCPIGHIFPSNEAQARPLTKLNAANQHAAVMRPARHLLNVQ